MDDRFQAVQEKIRKGLRGNTARKKGKSHTKILKAPGLERKRALKRKRSKKMGFVK